MHLRSHGKNAKAVPLREGLHLLQILKVEVAARHCGCRRAQLWLQFPNVRVWGLLYHPL